MDDDQNRTLDFNEFKKGITEYGLNLEPKVQYAVFDFHPLPFGFTLPTFTPLAMVFHSSC